jgi:hypothetical protein
MIMPPSAHEHGNDIVAFLNAWVLHVVSLHITLAPLLVGHLVPREEMTISCNSMDVKKPMTNVRPMVRPATTVPLERGV